MTVPARDSGVEVAHVLWRAVAGGAERHVLDLVRGLPGRGFRCGVIYLSTDDGVAETLREADVPCTCCHLASAWDARGPARLRAAVRRMRPRILHDHVSAPWVRAVAPATGAGRIIASEHGHVLNPRMGRRPVHTWIERFAAGRTDWFIAPSAAVARGVVSVLGAPADRVRVIHHGIAIPPAGQVNGATRAAARAEFGLGPERIVIVYAGRLTAEKGVLDLWEAFGTVIAAEPRAFLLVLGSGPLAGELARRRAAVGWAADVALAGHRLDLTSVLGAGDILVLPSHHEAFGLALLEAMAWSLPTVGTRAGGIPEVIGEGETGLLVPIGSPPDLARQILALARDPDRRASMGRAGRERLERHFTLERCVAETGALYREALAQSDGQCAGRLVDCPEVKGDRG